MATNYYFIDVHHSGLGKFRRIKHADKWVVEQMAARQRATWDEMWERKQAVEFKRLDREAARELRQANKETAVERTEEASKALEEIATILARGAKEPTPSVWDLALDRKPFSKPAPDSPPLRGLIPKPDISDFAPKIGILDRLFAARHEAKIIASQERFQAAQREWERKSSEINARNESIKVEQEKALTEWKREKNKFFEAQSEFNQQVTARKMAYEAKNPDAVAEYCDRVVSASDYPEWFSGDCEMNYNPETSTLVVEYSLPAPDALPSVKEVKYIQAREEFKEVQISEVQAKKLYEHAIYGATLKTLHTIFKADYIDALSSIVFNGWVNSIDKASGHESNSCVVSVQATKTEFIKINLANVDPKACFKSLKGLSCSALHTLTPVAPLMQLDKEDSRFVNSYAVANGLDGATNLASMDWEDFEHLIRELFEKEFSTSGGEVKVTQASRDGGVDAVAFDPDPIRGGKIVIQAKRYTNTVGVSAVRDLYGTLMNEGANKGILVTTSDYGPDAYEFAKGKPISLLTGANLLHLLAKHGHQARIDIREAKLIQSEKDA